MSKGLLLIDANNIGHAANHTKSLKVGEHPTQATYGFLRTLRPMITTFEMLTPIVLWDGASWRKMIYNRYKENRISEPKNKTEEKQLKLREEYKKQTPDIRKAVEMLGVRQIEALNYEADDLAAMLTQKATAQGKRVLLISGDKDWIQLVGPNVGWLDPLTGDRVTLKTMPEKLGYHPEKGRFAICNGKDVIDFIPVPSPRAWVEIKAMMGDISDAIPGVGGIGPKGAADIIKQYGSVGSLMNQVNDKTIDVETLPKKVRDFVVDLEKQDNFHRNLLLVDLNIATRPKPEVLKITPGAYDTASFGALCKELMFRSMLTDLNGWCEPFRKAA